MKNIGVILPYKKQSNFFAEFFRKFRWETVFIKEYGFNFILVNDNQNCSRIFNKNGVEHIVLLTDLQVERCDFKVLNGDSAYKKLLPEYVRKTVKKMNGNGTVTVVDKYLTNDGIRIIDKLCDFCHSLCICTQNHTEAEKLCDDLLDRYGIVVSVMGENDLINTDIAVVLEDCGNDYGKNCLIIDKNRREKAENIINDFYIPLHIKPPFGMSNLIFLECIDIINC